MRKWNQALLNISFILHIKPSTSFESVGVKLILIYFTFGMYSHSHLCDDIVLLIYLCGKDITGGRVLSPLPSSFFLILASFDTLRIKTHALMPHVSELAILLLPAQHGSRNTKFTITRLGKISQNLSSTIRIHNNKLQCTKSQKS